MDGKGFGELGKEEYKWNGVSSRGINEGKGAESGRSLNGVGAVDSGRVIARGLVLQKSMFNYFIRSPN